MKYLLTLLLMLALSTFAIRAAAPPAPAGDKLQTAGQVFKIFEAKCADCHGAHLSKPKGKFGYVLDLGRVAKNPEYIVPGNLEKSELYQMVMHNEMPGEDADVPPLTPDELKVVAHWVMLGAPGDLPPGIANASVAAASTEPAPASGAAAAGAAPFGQRMLTWVGRFHPASTHFPVALLLTAVLAELLAWWFKKPEWTLLVRFLVVLGALSAIPTANLGWLANFPTRPGSPIQSVYSIHRILGTATAVWGLVCAVMICLPGCREGSTARLRFRGALILGAALVAVTGFLGGKLTFGIDHYDF